MAICVRSFILRRAALALAALLSACSDPQLSSARPELAIEADAIDFPRTFVGYPTRVEVEVRNVGFAPLVVEVLAARPFAPDASSFEVGSGNTFKLGVVFDPAEPGPARGRLELRADERAAEIAISGTAELPPVCPTGTACRPIAFDPAAGLCVETVLPDTIPCPLDDLCLVDPRCEAGECVGRQKNCDDKNECTRDSCSPTLGCVHQDTSAECPPPTSGNPCEVALCDPTSGCGVGDADDGTLCGPADCKTADICLFGGCRTVSTPDGFPCAPATPCQGGGVCRNEVCDRPAPTSMQPLWTYEAEPLPASGDSPPAPGEVGGRLSLVFSGTVDPRGNLYLLETGSFCDEVTCFWGYLVSLTRDGFVRYRQSLEGYTSGYTQALVLDPTLDALYLTDGATLVEARRRSDGGLLWRHSPCELALQGPCGWEDLEAPTPTPRVAPEILAIEALVPVGTPTSGLIVSARETDYTAADFRQLILLSAETGWEQWRRSWEGGQAPALLADERGDLFLSDVGDFTQWTTFSSIAPDGQPRWSSLVTGFPLATAAGRVVAVAPMETSQGLAVDARDGSVLYGFAEELPPLSEVLLAPQGLFVIGNPLVSAGLSSGITRVSALDPSTGTSRWSLLLTECATPGTFAVSSRGTLVGVTDSCPLIDSLIPTYTLREIAPGGREIFACPLPDFPTGGSALVAGRWFAQLGSSLKAFDAPGLDLAPRGWVTSGGSLSRAHRPR